MSAALEIGAPASLRARQEADLLCAHCGLEVPRARLDPSSNAQFCCDGCRSVFAILHASGLQDFYAQREPNERRALSPQGGQRKFEELDEPDFRKSHCQDRGDGVLGSEFFVEGVHCSACVWLLERLPRVAPAVLEARYDLTRSVLQISWDPTLAPLSAVARALDSLGYPPHPTHATTLAKEQRKGDRALLLRVGIAGAAAGNVMLMALALYSGKYAGMAVEYTALFRWASLAIATPAVFWA
ncbi:MAG TPA: heavy metal translocating P-type ATPase metal-binding domain-containing protein, partial [Polyangiaceae bacterium]